MWYICEENAPWLYIVDGMDKQSNDLYELFNNGLFRCWKYCLVDQFDLMRENQGTLSGGVEMVEGKGRKRVLDEEQEGSSDSRKMEKVNSDYGKSSPQSRYLAITNSNNLANLAHKYRHEIKTDQKARQF